MTSNGRRRRCLGPPLANSRWCKTGLMTSPFDRLLARATADQRVLGVVLGGGRGKGFATEYSDWDVYVATVEGADNAGIRADLDAGSDDLELLWVASLDAFRSHATVGTDDEWNAYNFVHLKPDLDRSDGELKAICDSKEFLPPEYARSKATRFLDGYLNSLYRSLKNQRDGNLVAAHLDAAESVCHLLGFIFAAEGRVRPYNKFLIWELARHPLAGDWWATGDPAPELLAGGTPFSKFERQARKFGFSDVLDDWGDPALGLLRAT